MPVIFNTPTAEHYAATDSRFDATVRRLAPIIRQLREDPARRSTRKLADRLNNMGQLGPNGRKFTPDGYLMGQPRRDLELDGDATTLAGRCIVSGHF
jgi:hypothetical protein